MSKLTNYAKIILGGTPATNRPDFWDGGIPWVSVVDFTDSKKIYTTEKTITESGLSQSNTKLLNEGDIIVSARGTVGKMAVCGKKMAFNQSCYALLTKDNNKLNQNFLFYLLREKIKYLRQMAVGGVFNTIIKSTLEKIPVKLPNISTQEKITDVLSAYDDLIDIKRRRIQLLEESARLLFREWFVHFRFPGHEKVKLVDGVPEGWRFAKVKDLGQIVTGKTPSKKNIRNFDGNVPFIKTPDMHQSWIILNTEETLSEIGASLQNNKYLPPWSVLVSCIGTVGVVAMNLFKSQTNQQINSVIPKNKFYRYYSFFCLSNINPYWKQLVVDQR